MQGKGRLSPRAEDAGYTVSRKVRRDSVQTFVEHANTDLAVANDWTIW